MKQVEKVCIWTPDKDLAQCVVADRVVQIDRRSNQIRDAAAVRAKFGVEPESFPTIWRLSATPRMATRAFRAGSKDCGDTD